MFKCTLFAGWQSVDGSAQLQTPTHHMNRTVLALLVCFLIIVAYILIGASLELKNGGGTLPMLGLMAAVVATWKGIRGSETPAVPVVIEPESEPVLAKRDDQS